MSEGEKAKWMFPKIGVFPPKWMVKIMENPINMDDLGGKPHYFRKHPNGTHISKEELGTRLTGDMLAFSRSGIIVGDKEVFFESTLC